MDLNQLDTKPASDEGAVLHLKHPGTGEILTDDQGKPMWIKMAGVDGERYRAARRSQLDRRMRSQKAQVSTTDLEADGLEILVAATMDWHIQLHGETPRAEPGKVREVYAKFPWIQTQVDSFVADRSNFLPASPKT